jgi:hypothetical protein
VAASFEHDPRSNPKADLQAHERAKAAVAAHMHHQACTQHATHMHKYMPCTCTCAGHAHAHAQAMHMPCTYITRG